MTLLFRDALELAIREMARKHEPCDEGKTLHCAQRTVEAIAGYSPVWRNEVQTKLARAGVSFELSLGSAAPSNLLTYAEAAQELTSRGVKVSERTVRSWARCRKLRTFRTGRKVRIPLGAIDDLINKNTR